MSERIGDNYQKENPLLIVVSVAAVVVIVGLSAWWVLAPEVERDALPGLDPSAEVSAGVVDVAPAPEPAAVDPVAPDIPLVSVEAPTADEAASDGALDTYNDATGAGPAVTPEPESIPDLEQSDPTIRQYFSTLSEDTNYRLLWQTDNLLQRWVTVLDGAARGEIIKGVIGFQPPKEAFPVMRRGANYYLSAKGFGRYDGMVKRLLDIDPVRVSQGFHRFRPLLEQAYGQMGYDPQQLDNMVIKLLDRVIAAPIFPAGVELLAKSVNYTFADPSIEALPSLEKQLIRMGPENTTALQGYAKQLRAELLNPN